MSKTQKILILEDDATFRTLLAQALRGRGLETIAVGTLDEARDLAPTVTHAVVDLRLENENGLEAIPLLRNSGCMDIIVLTGYGSIETALEALRLGAKNFLLKPVAAGAIIEALFGPPLTPSSAAPSKPTLTDVKWSHIQSVLLSCEGNISHAAKILGIKRQSLQRYLRRGRTS